MFKEDKNNDNNKNHFNPLKIRQFMWMHGNRIYKASLCRKAGTLYIFDKDNKLILKRIGIKDRQMNKIEKQLDDAMKKNINPMYIL